MAKEIAEEYIKIREIFEKIGFEVIGTKLSETETFFLVRKKRKFKRLFKKKD